MSYKIEKAGYEYRGYKLGEKVMYNGQESMIIGFDENETSPNEKFIAVLSDKKKNGIKNSIAVNTVLDVADELNLKYAWVYESDITRLIKPKSKLTSTIKVEVAIESELPKPRIENSQDELIVRIGKHTFYYNKSMDAFGMSSCHADDNYDETVGLAVAYMRAMRRE